MPLLTRLPAGVLPLPPLGSLEGGGGEGRRCRRAGDRSSQHAARHLAHRRGHWAQTRECRMRHFCQPRSHLLGGDRHGAQLIGAERGNRSAAQVGRTRQSVTPVADQGRLHRPRDPSRAVLPLRTALLWPGFLPSSSPAHPFAQAASRLVLPTVQAVVAGPRSAWPGCCPAGRPGSPRAAAGRGGRRQGPGAATAPCQRRPGNAGTSHGLWGSGSCVSPAPAAAAAPQLAGDGQAAPPSPAAALAAAALAAQLAAAAAAQPEGALAVWPLQPPGRSRTATAAA
ncbi:hypothetical protein V8C86DRAFT_2813909 [Haematococcus lacustris]